MYWGYHFWGMHLFWWIFWFVGVSALLYWAWPSSRARNDRRDLARDRLRERYAAGEITDDEYRHRRSVLDERDDHASPRAARSSTRREVPARGG